jgi:hypothetical protein
MAIKLDFGKKVLTKDIPGQLLLPGPRYSFKYGSRETVYRHTTFQFHHSFGGHTGSPEQTPPPGYKWIRSGDIVLASASEKNWPIFGIFIWEVRDSDLEGNFRDIA